MTGARTLFGRLFQRAYRRDSKLTEFEPEQEFWRTLKAVDRRGRKTGTYQVRIDYNLLTPKRIWHELETFQNFAIVTGGDATSSFFNEVFKAQRVTDELSQRIAGAKSRYEAKHLQIQQDAMNEYLFIAQTILKSLENSDAEREKAAGKPVAG